MSSIRNKRRLATGLALSLAATGCAGWTATSTPTNGCVKHVSYVTAKKGSRTVRQRKTVYLCPPADTTTTTGGSTTGGNGSTTTGDTGLGGCPMFPANNYWHANVSSLPVHPQSSQWVKSLGTSSTFHPDFLAGTWQGNPIGFPITTVGAGQPKVGVNFYYASESDPGPYPLPFNAPIEPNGDRHVIVTDTSECKLYEIYDAHPGATPTANWTAGSGAIYDLRSNAMRPTEWTSADAAGLPMLPGMVRYEEIAAGQINHAIRFTGSLTQHSYTWPARHRGAWNDNSAYPPMGAWFRLRADYPTDKLGPQARIVAEAMKKHGIILADIGASWYLSGVQDERWSNDDLLGLHQISGADMVAVDVSSIIVDPNSGQVRQ